VAVRENDPRTEALLGYLISGQYSSARIVGPEIVRDAEQLLFEKMRDPTGAAVAGYYLLKTGHFDSLHDWTRNLADWFPWLPDGAVIRAWHVWRQERSDYEEARERLLQAAGRGIPLYTQGLRLLLDGLNLLHHKATAQGLEDSEIAAALEQVRPYARAADWRAPTTTFYARHPSEPDWRTQSGAPYETGSWIQLPRL
jgi:hypothetical protein